jgi:hypothetical protein
MEELLKQILAEPVKLNAAVEKSDSVPFSRIPRPGARRVPPNSSEIMRRGIAAGAGWIPPKVAETAKPVDPGMPK